MIYVCNHHRCQAIQNCALSFDKFSVALFHFQKNNILYFIEVIPDEFKYVKLIYIYIYIYIYI